MIDYRVFEIGEPYSSRWNDTEIEVLARAFELRRLTVVTRGKRKHQTNIASPGESRASRPTDLVNGALEWAITHEAFEVYRQFRPVQEAKRGIFAVYLNPDPSRKLSSPMLKKVAQTLGWQVGFAVALWNDIGSVWPDLWDYYSTAGSNDEIPAYQPFLEFFRLVQLSRSSWDDEDSFHESAQRVIEQMIDGMPGANREPFAEDYPLTQVLLNSGVQQEKIDSLRKFMNSWPSPDKFLSLLAEVDRALVQFDKTTEQSERSRRLSGLRETKSVLEQRRWDAAGKLLESKHTREQLQTLVQVLNYCGVELNFINDVQGLGKFDIQVLESDSTIEVVPSITVRYSEEDAAAPYRLALCHEIGHFVHHFSWVVELRLADLAIKHLYQNDFHLADKVRVLRKDIHKRLIQNHSAIEITADEFAVDILLPDRIRDILVDFCSTGEGFRVGDFVGHVLDMLGIGVGGKNLPLYGSRFISIIEAKMPQRSLASPIVSYGSSLRRLLQLASKRRVDKLLDSFWSDSLAIIAGSSIAHSIKSPSTTRKSVKSELYFEGLVCD